jgi:hypothetical protein
MTKLTQFTIETAAKIFMAILMANLKFHFGGEKTLDTDEAKKFFALYKQTNHELFIPTFCR